MDKTKSPFFLSLPILTSHHTRHSPCRTSPHLSTTPTHLLPLTTLPNLVNKYGSIQTTAQNPAIWITRSTCHRSSTPFPAPPPSPSSQPSCPAMSAPAEALFFPFASCALSSPLSPSPPPPPALSLSSTGCTKITPLPLLSTPLLYTLTTSFFAPFVNPTIFTLLVVYSWK